MTERSLQVTYRKGKPFSAYLHLSHQTGEKSARTVPSADGLLVVDHGQNGKAIGVEITAPSAVAFGSPESTPQRARGDALERARLPAGASGTGAASVGRSGCVLSAAITRLIMPLPLRSDLSKAAQRSGLPLRGYAVARRAANR